MTLLCDLAKKYETDKGGYGHMRYGGGDSDTCHNYTPYYHDLLGDRREEIKTVLEIGVHQGCSVRMWKEYFPNAQILGIDTNGECIKHAEDRITVMMADQNNPHQLMSAATAFLCQHERFLEGFDLIVDDGSHEREHQIVSLETLWRYLAKGGYYVVEDVGVGDVDIRSLMWAVPGAATMSHGVRIDGGWGPKVQPYEWLFVAHK